MDQEKNTIENKSLRSAKDIAMEKVGVEIKKETGNLRSAKDIANERADKIIEDTKKQPEKQEQKQEVKVEKVESEAERKKAIDEAIQRVLNAEDDFEKRKKSQKKFESLASKFKMVLNSKDEKEEKRTRVTGEYNKAEEEKDQAKKAMDELIKNYARRDIEGGKSEFETKMAMLDDKDKLDKSRIESRDKQTKSLIKRGMENWHKRKWYTQMGITLGLVAGGEALFAFGGIVAITGGLMVAGGAGLEALGTATGVDKMLGSAQKWYRGKQGMTKEAKTKEARAEFVGEENDEEQGIENLLKNFEQHDVNLNKKLEEVFKVEHRDKITRWAVAVAAGLVVGGLRAQHAIAKGIDANAVKTAKEAIGPVPKPTDGPSASRMNEYFMTEAGKELKAQDAIFDRAEKLSQQIGQGAGKGTGKAVESIAEQGLEKAGGGIPLPPGMTEQMGAELHAVAGKVGKGAEAVTKATEGALESLAKQVAESPDKFKAVIEAGSSQWKTAEKFLSKGDVLGFNTMNEAQKTHLIDSVLTKIGKDSMVKPGDVLDFGKIFGNNKALETVMESNKGIIEGSKKFVNIMGNNATIKEWAMANPGKALNTETVKGIISGGKNVVDKAAKAGETFVVSSLKGGLENVPTSAVAAKKATFEAIKKIGAGIKKIPEFAGESGVWAQTSDMSVYKFMEESSKGAIKMSEKVIGTSNVVSKRAMTGEEIKVIKFMRDYISKIGDVGGVAGRPEKGQTVMEYINAFRLKNGVAPYNKFGVLNTLEKTASKVNPVLAKPL